MHPYLPHRAPRPGRLAPAVARTPIVVVVALVTSLATPTATADAASPQSASATAASSRAEFPRTPPARICGNKRALTGPAKPPAGAVPVKPGQDLSSLTQARPAGTTFWLAPGSHTLGRSEFAQIAPKDNNVYIGAPGAVLDGKHINRYAFTQHATGVKIRNLTIQNFGRAGANHNEGVVNHDSATGWTMERLTVRNNAGAGIFVGSDNVVRYNCLTRNRQYGLSGYRPAGITNVTVARNEISHNNTDDWELRQQGCGCSGGAKFWDVTGALVAKNWVHHNKGPGLWADTNNIGFRFEGNYIDNNDAEGIFYEVSYNALIRDNTLVRNALVKGRAFAARGDNFPVGAIYLSESGGDSRVHGGALATLEVTGNLLSDNWGGVVLWENADRFCGSDGNTSRGYCTVPGAGSLKTCVAATISDAPYVNDCRWKTQNVWVHDNDLQMDAKVVGCTSTTTSCGVQALISNWGTYPAWSPYKARTVQEALTFGQNNRFSSNRYAGAWRFNGYEPGRILTLAEWQGDPYRQDAGSTVSATAPTGAVFAPLSPDRTRIRVTWRNPVSLSWARTVVRRAEGTKAPTRPTSGTAVYSGTASAVTDRVVAGRTYRYAAFAYDSAGKVTRTVSPPVTALDRPVVSVPSPTSTGTRGLPFRVTWAAPKATSYAVQYTERLKVDGRWVLQPWTTWRANTRATSGVFNPVTGGRILYFRAQARDASGNATPFTRRGARAVVPLDDSSELMSYTGEWSTVRAKNRWGGSESATNKRGSTMTLVAEGSAFAVIGARCDTCGTFDVVVDGVLKATVDARSDKPRLRTPLYLVRLPGGIATHRVVIRARGAAKAPWTRIDAIGVIR